MIQIVRDRKSSFLGLLLPESHNHQRHTTSDAKCGIMITVAKKEKEKKRRGKERYDNFPTSVGYICMIFFYTDQQRMESDIKYLRTWEDLNNLMIFNLRLHSTRGILHPYCFHTSPILQTFHPQMSCWFSPRCLPHHVRMKTGNMPAHQQNAEALIYSWKWCCFKSTGNICCRASE